MANSTVNKTDGQSLSAAEVMDIVNATNSKQDKEAGKGLSDVNFTTTKDAKLTGIATGATANATDSALRDRATHTGTQTSSTISDFTEAVQDAVAALLGGGSNVTLTYNDTANTLTISATGGSTDLEAVRDAIGVALVPVGNIGIAINDAADTITISTTATVNDTDANLKARANHTGTQSADTLTDGTTNKAFLATERTKLTGITAGATANDTDANLKARANHTGVQAISTITGLQAALDAKLTNAPVVQVHTTGSTLTLADATTRAVINPATTLSSVNAILAATPYDGQRQAIYVGGTITSGTVVSSLTVTASQGIIQAPAFTPTDAQYGDTYTFEYLASTSKWYLL